MYSTYTSEVWSRFRKQYTCKHSICYLITEVDVELFDITRVQKVGSLDNQFEKTLNIDCLVLELDEQLFLEPTVSEHVGQVLCVLFDPQVRLWDLAHLYFFLDQLHYFFISAIIYLPTTYL